MIVWADRWQADGCLEICLIKLAEIDIEDLTVPEANAALFELPESVMKSAAFESIESMRKNWLSEEFSWVQFTIVDEGTLESFQSLYFVAVHTWVTLDELAAENENDVAVLLALWHYGEVGQRCSDDERLMLGQALRVNHLTPLFRRLMLPELAWFKGHVERVNIFASLWDTDEARTIPDTTRDLFPAAWSTAPRRDISVHGHSAIRRSISVYLSVGCLESMLQMDAKGMYHEIGRESYANGYFWKVRVQMREGKMVALVSSISHDPVPAAPCVKFSSTIGGSVHEKEFTFIHSQDDAEMSKIDLFTDIGGPIRSIEQLKPHMTGSLLCVRLELKNVNEVNLLLFTAESFVAG